MEDNRNSDRSEEELRRIIREKIRRSRAKWGKNLCVRTQAMIPQASSALASSVMQILVFHHLILQAHLFRQI